MDQPTPSDGPLPKDLFRQPEGAPDPDAEAAAEAHQAYVTLLFNKYRAALQRYLCRFVAPDDAAELVQEAYFRLLRRGDLVRIEPMARAFLFETGTNLARDLRRRRATRHADQHVQLDGQELAEDHQRPDEQLAGEQMRVILERAIAALPQDTRTVFLLHRYRDLSYPQIAELTRLSPRTVARKMAEAIERLSAALGGTS